jgi:hypothetical protein
MRATTKRRLERLAWFAGLYAASLLAVAAIAYALRWLIIPG